MYWEQYMTGKLSTQDNMQSRDESVIGNVFGHILWTNHLDATPENLKSKQPETETETNTIKPMHKRMDE